MLTADTIACDAADAVLTADTSMAADTVLIADINVIL